MAHQLRRLLFPLILLTPPLTGGPVTFRADPPETPTAIGSDETPPAVKVSPMPGILSSSER